MHGGLHKLGVQFAQPRSTAVQYSNAIDFDRASLPSNAQIHAQTCLDDRHAPSSQRGGRGFGSPQLHRYRCKSKTLSERRGHKTITPSYLLIRPRTASNARPNRSGASRRSAMSRTVPTPVVSRSGVPEARISVRLSVEVNFSDVPKGTVAVVPVSPLG